jgi:hypothetical protein
MKPAHDTPPPPYTFLEKALVKCTWRIETFGCVKSTQLVRCFLTVQKITFASFGESLWTTLHGGITHKTSNLTWKPSLFWSTFPYEPDEYEKVDSAENITSLKSRIYYIIPYKNPALQNTAPLPSLKWLP